MNIVLCNHLKSVFFFLKSGSKFNIFFKTYIWFGHIDLHACIASVSVGFLRIINTLCEVVAFVSLLWR